LRKKAENKIQNTTKQNKTTMKRIEYNSIQTASNNKPFTNHPSPIFTSLVCLAWPPEIPLALAAANSKDLNSELRL